MKIHFETKRLIVRDLEELDAKGIFELDSDPEVHKYLGNKPIKTIREAEEVVNSIRKQYDKNGIGRWAIIDKSSEEFIGWTGLKYEENLEQKSPYYDLGYRLKKKYWGQGIASETAAKSLQFGFNQLELPEICAAADVNNVASNKVLIKIGLKCIEAFPIDGDIHNWYQITKSEWLAVQQTREVV